MAKSKAQQAADAAFEAGQAAQRDHLTEDVCPFAEGDPQRDAWLEGRRAKELGDHWVAGGTALRQTIQEGSDAG